MKKYTALLLVPLVATIVLFAGVLATAPGEERLAFYLCDILLVKALATAGCFYAAFGFRRGDYLRRAWLYLGVSYLLLLAIDVFTPPPPHSGISNMSLAGMRARGATVLLSNLAAVIGIFMLARTWKAAGLEPSGTVLSRRAISIGISAAVIVIVGQSIYDDALQLLAGHLLGFASVTSDVGDLICLLLIVPVLLTALALRGGVLGWPWLLLSAAQISWLLYDAVANVGFAFHLPRTQMRPFEELGRTWACTFACISGVAQRWAIARPRK